MGLRDRPYFCWAINVEFVVLLTSARVLHARVHDSSVTSERSTMGKETVAEAIGTFVLVFCGLGTAVIGGARAGYLGVALAFGLALLVMVYVIGPISGCHINPAVTLGALLARRIEPRKASGYVCAQVAGAIAGAGLVLAIARGAPGGFSATALAPNGYGFHSPAGYSAMAGFTIETVLTLLLVLTVLAATDVKAPVGFAGIPIGLVLTIIHLVGIPVTNASVNPARSIGSAVFAGGWALQQLWLFIVAPCLGAMIAAGLYRAVRVSTITPSLRRADQALESEQLERGETNPAA